ncbi:MAG: hypothetical protein DWQ36_18750 [Acidobacteria bacterium]|nr:MAG: hypothetical protein DWQ30_03690 [Acidobacteriota bacterium]REK03813.1 MAG: hypothetical protein DWQ36_18750 [Acidobacteriota bacterium]
MNRETGSPSHDLDWHDRVADIVVEASELQADERDEYLVAACGDDAAMLAEVRSLLDEEANADDGFLAVPVPERLGASPYAPVEGSGEAESRAPDRVGPYRLVERLGAGGMGAVFLAEQTEPVERRVAVKLIRGLQSERARRRFQAECQALAHLNHPNVASMYEVGSVEHGDEPLPYIAMEWVAGKPIHQWCDERRDSLRQRVRLFLGVCAGIAHAHENQVLHCDLKPSNILVTEVDGEPRAKVIDFGISRALGDGSPKARAKRLTTDLFMGSPLYMSPEAADTGRRRHLDTRSDVYSLGVVLYELLCGVLPVDPDQQVGWALLHRVNQQQAPPPSDRLRAVDAPSREVIAECRSTSSRRLASALRGDLDAVVLKAMSPDPAARYGSPRELAADLERYLARQPVTARPARPGYVLGRFVVRRASAVVAVGVVILALLAGLVGRTLEARRANEAARQAEAALAESEQVREFVVRLFDAADPESGGRGTTVEEVLDRGLEQLETDLVDLPLVRAELLLTIGSIYDKLALYTRAETVLRQALELRLAELPPGHEEVLETRDFLGVLLRKARNFEAAAEQLELVLEGRLADPDVHPERLALAYSHLGNLRWAQDRFEAAEVHHREALRIREENDVPAGAIAESANNLGVLLNSQGRDEEALPYLELAAERFDEQFGPRHNSTAAAINNLGLVLRRTPRWREALDHFERAGATWSELLGREHPRTQFALRNRLSELQRLHRWPEALAAARELVEVTVAVDDALAQPRAHRLLSTVERLSGDAEAAVRSAETSVRLHTERVGADHAATLRARRVLAQALLAAKRPGAARSEIEEVVDRFAALSGAAADETLLSLSTQAEIWIAEGDTEQAVEQLRQVVAAREAEGGSGRSSLAYGRLALGEALTAAGRSGEAIELLELARQGFVALHGEQHPNVVTVDAALSLALQEDGAVDQARQALSRAVQAAAELFPAGDADLGRYRRRLADLAVIP